MSDPVVPQPENAADRAESTGGVPADAVTETSEAAAAEVSAPEAVAAAPAVDPDLAAFEEAERHHPGTFTAATSPVEDPETVRTDLSGLETRGSSAIDPVVEETAPRPLAEETGTFVATGTGAAIIAEETLVAPVAPEPFATAPLAAGLRDEGATVVQPVVEPAPVYSPQPPQHPIFVQAPEPPRERSNRGTAAAIGLLAALAFAVLMFATALLIGLLTGDMGVEGIGEVSLAMAQTWMVWTPTVVFFLAFWLLGVAVNRGRWGLWVNLGLIVGLVTWVGFVLGNLLQAPFWNLTFREGMEISFEAAFSPMGLVAFIFARELTIWFGAWAARSGARKSVLNAEAQREYERTLEAGPTLMR